MKYLIMRILRKLGFLKQENPIDYALKVVEATKPEEWTMGELSSGWGQSCFLGHIAKSYGKNVKTMNTVEALNIPEIKEIDEKIIKYVEEKHDKLINHSYQINDNDDINGYREAHPRDRMLHVLRDMKRDGWKQVVVLIVGVRWVSTTQKWVVFIFSNYKMDKEITYKEFTEEVDRRWNMWGSPQFAAASAREHFLKLGITNAEEMFEQYKEAKGESFWYAGD